MFAKETCIPRDSLQILALAPKQTKHQSLWMIKIGNYSNGWLDVISTYNKWVSLGDNKHNTTALYTFSDSRDTLFLYIAQDKARLEKVYCPWHTLFWGRYPDSNFHASPLVLLRRYRYLATTDGISMEIVTYAYTACPRLENRDGPRTSIPCIWNTLQKGREKDHWLISSRACSSLSSILIAWPLSDQRPIQ